MGKGKAKETGKGRWMGGVNNCCYYYLQFVSEGGVWEGGNVNAKRVPCMTLRPSQSEIRRRARLPKG